METNFYDQYDDILDTFGFKNKNIADEKLYELLLEQYKPITAFTVLSEGEQADLREILNDYGSARIVEIYMEIFGSLPPVGEEDVMWTSVAAKLGNLEMMKRIHSYGFELDELKGGVSGPLDFGILHEEIVEYLLSIGARPLVNSFGFYACRPDTFSRSLLRKIWEIDPLANEHGVLEAFKSKNLETVDWFHQIGAKFSNPELLYWACENLWVNWTIELISIKKRFKAEDLIMPTRFNGKIPLEASLNNYNNSKMLCEFINTLMPLYSAQIKTILKVPESGKHKSKCGKCGQNSFLLKLPCDHFAHETCLVLDSTECPICFKLKYQMVCL